MLYRWTRDLHLYAGLFISPFVVLFALSVFFLNHVKVSPGSRTPSPAVENLEIPAGIETAQGRDAIAIARLVLQQVNLDGEVLSARFTAATGHFVVAVATPRLDAIVDVSVSQRTATVSRRATGFLEAIAYLHKMPGPHNVAIRGNWPPTLVWSKLADTTVYLTLFVTISGIYLWWVLKAERRVGLALLSSGFLTFAGLAYVLVR